MSDTTTTDNALLEILTVLSPFIVGGIVFGVAVLLVVGLLKAGRLPPSVALVISLSILTLVSIIGFIFTLETSNSAELATLAGTGLGALAGAVTAVWSDTEARRREHEDTE